MKELRFIPVPRHPKHSDLRLAGDGERIEQQRADDAENRGRSPSAQGQRQNGKQQIRRAADQPPGGIAQINDPTLQDESSGLHSIGGARLEACPTAPPTAAGERRQRAEELPPEPDPRSQPSLGRRALGVLRRQISKHLVTLCVRDQRPEQDGGKAFQVGLMRHGADSTM
jgi:hypothetical protein